jgi:hypothetical protein
MSSTSRRLGIWVVGWVSFVGWCGRGSDCGSGAGAEHGADGAACAGSSYTGVC